MQKSEERQKPVRITKPREERYSEILDTAEALFGTKGYQKTSVNDILEAIGIAKGTFYYYFKSKEEVLDSVIDRFAEEEISVYRAIADDESLDALEKFERVLTRSPKNHNTRKFQMVENLHSVTNEAVHLRSIVESVTALVPIVTEIVEQGVREEVFSVEHPRETVELMLVGAQFLFDSGIFPADAEQMLARIKVMSELLDLVLGAAKGTFSYLYEVYVKAAKALL